MNKNFHLIILFLLGSYSIISAADGRDINPLKISHKIHLAIPNVNCATCHEGTDTSISSSDVLLPSRAVCLTCHKSDSPELDQSENLKFILKEPELNFNHKYHTVTRELPCFVCHVNVKDVDILTEANMPPMTTCFNCHNDKVAPTDCSWCHINEDELRPEFHTADWLHKHPFKFNSAVFKPEENCMMCHQENWCQDCHIGSQLARSSSKSVTPFFQPTERGKKPQSIGRVHSLNYRFLHPIEAKGKDRFSWPVAPAGFAASHHSARSVVRSVIKMTQRYKKMSGMPSFVLALAAPQQLLLRCGMSLSSRWREYRIARPGHSSLTRAVSPPGGTAPFFARAVTAAFRRRRPARAAR